MVRRGVRAGGWVIGLALLAAAGPALGAPGDVLFQDRFDSGSAPGSAWSAHGGTFTVRGGRLELRSQQDNPVCRLNRNFAGDVSFSVRMHRPRRSHWVGLVARGVYWLTCDQERSELVLVRRENGQVTRLGAFAGYQDYIWSDSDLVVRLDIVGDRLRAFLDGKLVIEARDRGPAAGDLMLVGGWGTNTDFDDVVVREADPRAGDPAPARPALSFSVSGARVDRSDSIYGENEPVTVTLDLEGRPSGGTFDLRYRVLDLDGRVVHEERRTAVIPAGGAARDAFTFTPAARGAFKVRVEEVRPTGDAPRSDVVSFAVLPAHLRDRPDDPGSPMGGHPWWEQPDHHHPLHRRIGGRWARTHDFIQHTWWTNLEPQRGAFAVDPWHDQGVDLLRSERQRILGSFLWTPAWAGPAPTAPPTDLRDFASYVRQVVTHYRGRISHWEVWNEPHYAGFWTGTPEQYAELCRTAYDAARAADPSCVIVGGGGIDPGDRPWVERAFAAGMNRHMDVLSFHYGPAGSPFAADVARFEEDLAWLRSTQRRHGGERPLWNSETAVMSASFLEDFQGDYGQPDAAYAPKEAAAALVRLYVVNLAAGVEKIFYYYAAKRTEAMVRQSPVTTGLIDVRGGLKPTGVAYATCADHLTGKRFVRQVDVDPQVRAYLFEGQGEVVAFTWGLYGRDATPRYLHLPDWTGPALEQLDIMNDGRPLAAVQPTLPLSRIPVLVRVRGASAADLAAWLSGGKASTSATRGATTPGSGNPGNTGGTGTTRPAPKKSGGVFGIFRRLWDWLRGR